MDIEKQTEQSLNFNFDSFLRLSGLRTAFNTFKPNPNARIIKHAQFLLESNNYEAYGDLILQGYIPTSKQQKIIDQFVNATLSAKPYSRYNGNDKKYQTLEGLLGKGLKLNYSNIARFVHSEYTDRYHDQCPLEYNSEIFSNQNYIIKGHLSSSKGKDYYYDITYPKLTKQFREIVSQPEFSDYLLNEFKKSITTKLWHDKSNENNRARYTIERYREVLQHAPQLIFRNTSLKEVTKIIKKLTYHNISQDDSNLLNNIVNNLYKKDMQKIVEDTKTTYTDNSVRTLTIEKIRNEQYDMNDLPKNATFIINSIENLYKKIKENNFDDVEKLNTLNLLFEKRLPEVLTKYLKVDPEYRVTLKSSQGKNAQDLMIDSLNNIKDSFESVYQEINQNTVNSLSATNRYTKSIKVK